MPKIKSVEKKLITEYSGIILKPNMKPVNERQKRIKIPESIENEIFKNILFIFKVYHK